MENKGERSKIAKRSDSRPGFLIPESKIAKPKRSQVTMFIIIALVIISVILIYFFVVKPQSVAPKKRPEGFEGCMYDAVEENLEEIGKQGGFDDPEFYYLHRGEKIGYICYSDEYFKPCVVQKPFLKQHFENELVESSRDGVYDCYDDYIDELESRGYTVTGGAEKELNISILPENILIELNAPVTLSDEGSGSSRYTKFISVIDAELYEMLTISNSIVHYETRIGDAEISDFMDFYPNIVIDKLKQDDGTTIYILEDTKTNTKFQFASRSYALPPGYGVVG